MSIDRDTFENTSEDELEELSIPDQVLGFLAANEERVQGARDRLSNWRRRGRSQHRALTVERPRSSRAQGDVLGGDRRR